MTSSVLVTDGEERAALAVVRSLGRARHTVHVCSSRRRSIAGVSRYAATHSTVPDPLREPDRFAAAVAQLIQRHTVNVLIPVTEAAMLAVLEYRDLLEDVLIPFASRTAFDCARDKEHVANIACGLGIRVPRQTVLRSVDEARAADADVFDYPLVLKPARSVSGPEGGRQKMSVVHVAGRSELRAALDALTGAAYPLLVQQRIVGDGIGAFVLLWEGERRASFCHRRLREKPPSGGVSVYRESAAPDEALLAKSFALMERLGWQGVAMVEYKVDSATGTPYLMEINGRFWGSLQLAIDSGVDFPALLVAAATGETVAPVHDYVAGVRSRWFWGDVDHLIARLRYSARELSLSPGAPTRREAVRDFITAGFRPRERGEMLRLHDPGPALLETLEWLRRR